MFICLTFWQVLCSSVVRCRYVLLLSILCLVFKVYGFLQIRVSNMTQQTAIIVNCLFGLTGLSQKRIKSGILYTCQKAFVMKEDIRTEVVSSHLATRRIIAGCCCWCLSDADDP